jgi:hypothetical protein
VKGNYQANTPAMAEKLKKLRIGKQILPLGHFSLFLFFR